MKVEGVPPVPQSVADALAQYAQFRTARFVAWHPSKRQILINTSLGSSAQLHLVDGPGRDRHQLTWFPGAGISPRQSAPQFDPADGNSFVFMWDPAGGEARSVYRFDFTTGQATLAVPSKSRYDPAWSKQGKWLAYDSAERNGSDRDLYVVQPLDVATKRRLTDAGNFSAHDWSPDGKTILANEFVSNLESYLVLIDVQKGEKRYLTPRDGEKVFWYMGRFSPDGKKVYAISDRGAEFTRLWRCDLATGAWTALTATADNVDVGAGYGISPDGALLAFAFDRGAGNDLQLIDLTTGKPKTLPALPRADYGQIQWRPGSREVGFTMASNKAAGDVYSIDASLGTLTRWTFSETTFNTDVLPPPEIVAWKSSDGVAISGVLYKPVAKFKGKAPVFVSIHGGPDNEVARPKFMGRSNYFLNELGVAILFPNVRGSAGFGRKFMDLDNGMSREGAIKDIGAMLDWIATRPDLDAGKVLLTGPSYGGWLALEAGIVYNNRIAGIIEGAGITDFITFLEQQTPARQASRRAEYGDERDPDMRAYLKSISPITRASELKKPTFILHPGKDARVPVSQAQELVKALKANNAPVWYVEFTEANHDNFPGGAENYDYMMQTWVLFVKQVFLNDRPVGSASR